MSDIEIARKAKMQPIGEILDKINVPDTPEAFSPMGRHIAKINLEYVNTLRDKKDGKLILVTAITPTPAGEGKTTTSVGLNDGPKLGSLKQTIDFLPILFSPSLSPTEVVVFPSPAGVGVIAVTKINFPFFLFFKDSKYSVLIFAIYLPIGL